jgi:basic membrane protein A
MRGKTRQLIAILAGRADDGGFIESGYQGALAASQRHGLEFHHVEHIGTETAALVSAIDEAASVAPEMIVVHGGRSDEAVAATAPNHPHIQFLSTHGALHGANFSCYTIAQPESAFLAGALAGRLTRSGVVGHLSGIRISPGLRSRAAFAQGVRHTNPEATLLTCFCGTQEDNVVTYRAALAEIDAGIDILYTMLNGGRGGAISACRERGVMQIGNVRDWTVVDPDVFVASAVANTGRLVESWVDDLMSGALAQGELRTLGSKDAQAVFLAMAPRVPATVRAEMAGLAEDIRSGLLRLTEDYAGPEFPAPP